MGEMCPSDCDWFFLLYQTDNGHSQTFSQWWHSAMEIEGLPLQDKEIIIFSDLTIMFTLGMWNIGYYKLFGPVIYTYEYSNFIFETNTVEVLSYSNVQFVHKAGL